MHVYTYISVLSMGVKTITISLEAYEALRRLKKPGESFSDVILRLVSKRRSIEELAGAWRDVGDEEIGEVLKEIGEAWSRWGMKQAR